MRQLATVVGHAVALAAMLGLGAPAYAQLRLPGTQEAVVRPSLQADSVTNQLGLRVEVPIYRSWGFIGQYGRTAPLASESGAAPTLQGLSNAPGGRSLGLAKSETWLRGDRLSLTVAQPGAGTLGPLGFYAPADARNFAVNSLGSSGRELVTELQYFAPITRSSGLGFSLINRARANNNERAPDERIMMMRFSSEF